MKKYTEKHEWIEPAAAGGGAFRVGITNFAQEQLGDVVSVELPDVGRAVAADEEFATIESVKAASEIYAPAAGEITAVNSALEDNPALVNEQPEADGWLVEMRLSDASVLEGLMDAAAYEKFAAEQE